MYCLLKDRISVTIGKRLRGAVFIFVISRAPISANCRVRGMGVAVRVSTSTVARNFFRRSLCWTPNRCSSSMIKRPRSLNSTSFETNRCVPMTISILPLFNFSRICFCSALVRNRESISTFTGKFSKRSRNVL